MPTASGGFPNSSTKAAGTLARDKLDRQCSGCVAHTCDVLLKRTEDLVVVVYALR